MGCKAHKTQKAMVLYYRRSSVCSNRSFMVLLSRTKGKGQHPNIGFWSVQSSEGSGVLRARGVHQGVGVPHSASESSAAPDMV